MPSTVRRSRILALVALLWSVDGVAQQPPPIQLTWTGPEACSDNGEVLAQIDLMLGATTARASAQPIVADATAERLSDGRWRVTLRTRSGDTEGERTLEDADCDAIRKAAALLLALMIDPNAAPPSDAPPAPPPPPSPPPKPVPEPRPVRRRAPRPVPRRAEPMFSVGVDGVVDAGSLPAWAYGGRLTFGVATSHASLELRSTLWLPRTQVSASSPSAGGRFTMAEQAIALCGGSDRTRRLAVGVCAGPALVWMRGTGFGVTDPGSASALWPAAFVEGAAQIGLTRGLALRAAVGASASWLTPTFAIRQVGTIHTPHAGVARAALGVSYGF
jgi:hypothetical protein